MSLPTSIVAVKAETEKAYMYLHIESYVRVTMYNIYSYIHTNEKG